MQGRGPHIAVTRVDALPVQIVALVGDHDLESSTDVEAAIRRVLEASDAVIVDLSRLSFAESAVLGTLILADKRAGRGRFAVIAPPDTPAARLLSLVDAKALFRIFPTLTAAIGWSRTATSRT